MRIKKEFPRKRKRYIKKIIFFASFAAVLLLILLGFACYIIFEKIQRPLYISPVSAAARYAQDNHVAKEEVLLQNGLKKEQIAYATIVRGNGDFVVILQDGGKVTFSSQKDILSQIASLQYILSHLTMEGRQFKTLDLRFDTPVVVLKP